jgi:hypothetical protein
MQETTVSKEWIFESAGQAVHVAFLILAQEAQQDAPLRKALIRIMEDTNLTTDNQRDWLLQLRGGPSSAINFRGLEMGEVRALCARVTQAVRGLPAPETWALQAKFGQVEFEDIDDGQPHCNPPRRRFAFSAERIVAIKGLSDWFAPSFPKIPPFALDCLLGKLYANHLKIEISFRGLAQSFGGNHMAYARSFKLLKGRVRELEKLALQRLDRQFVDQGMISIF